MPRELPDQVCDESAGEAHHKDGCGYREDQVDGPRVIAFTHKVDVSSATFVSIDVEVHSSGLRQGLLYAEYHLLRPSWGGIGAFAWRRVLRGGQRPEAHW